MHPGGADLGQKTEKSEWKRRGAFTKARYTTAGEETVLGITIDRESWKKAQSGSYADTVTFQISYVDATD